jgi:tetratricopeptide (TPR) repeat protein
MNRSVSTRYKSRTRPAGSRARLALVPVTFAALIFVTPAQCALQASQGSDGAAIYGSVEDSHGLPVADATVKLTSDRGSEVTKTNAAGNFEFSALHPANYSVSAENSLLQSQTAKVVIATRQDRERVDIKLDRERSIPTVAGAASASPPPQFGFADNPDFQVAGVTDWTAVGGHGSDTTLRTSEALARETLDLKPQKAPEANNDSAQKRNADQHRLAGEREEKSGDPLGAVREFEQAVQLDPSEENYFAWGSELLLHRAVWQAQEVFRKGATAYPNSARMLSALGVALFAGARYEEAAQFLCRASELDPADPEAYIFMGKAQIAAPDPLPCVERKLARFVADHPDNSEANYLYAMAILKRTSGTTKPQGIGDAKKLLRKAVTVDPKCADGYLELGILASSSGDSAAAIDDLNQAIAANPELSEAHYRLGVAYDRVGQAEKAKREFALHDQLEKQQADEVERQRREIKQFVIVAPDEKKSPQEK